MAKKVFTKESIQADIDKFIEDGQFNKTTVSMDWMDAYVAKFQPADIATYVKDCLAIPAITTSNGKERKDTKGVREYFMKKYFPDYTDEAVEARKAEAKKKREEELAEKKRLENASLEEQLIAKLNGMK